jgi:uncharacterized protein (DUF697 family)
MSKKLPKVIGQTIDDLRRAKPNTRDETKSTRVSLASIPSPDGGRAGDVLAEEVRHRRAGAAPAASQPEKPEAVVPAKAETAPAAAASEPDKPAASEKPVVVPDKIDAPAAVVTAPVKPAASPVVVDRDAELHRARAREIVERHATYSAVGGFIPLPLVEIVSMTAIVHRMVKNLAEHYDVSFDRDRTRALIAGLLGGLAPLGLGALATASLIKIIPGANLIGLGVSSMAAAEGTRRIGYIFMAHFEGGGTLLDFRSKAE